MQSFAISHESIQTGDHLLISPDGAHLVVFRKAGNHQAWAGHFRLNRGQWILRRSGFNWVGRMRDQYRELAGSGYQRHTAA